ncbi:MAG: fumarylacetoacetate hydrolase family protein [Hyphomicrobiales bacterium]|nr:fumarylacetoacetate hydrolase family protein [Hyphomicrobiales bacterium]MDE2114997.1 fumarylacetoacetate hydrolase family protein [Hyphomicrobiales bacterium]
MTEFVFTPPTQPSLAIAGDTQRFPVRRVICVGRNYEAHAREMGKDPTREAPFFFFKPADAVVDASPELETTIPYPPLTQNFHHEIELVVAIGKGGANIPESQSLEHVWGYGVGIDLTRRDLQFVARDAGRPWDWGKGFDQAAPIAALHPVRAQGHLDSGRIWLAVNGRVKQDQDVKDLIWSVPEIIAIASQAMKLMPGDIIMTGTPAGVGPMVRGDVVTGGVAGLGEIKIKIV